MDCKDCQAKTVALLKLIETLVKDSVNQLTEKEREELKCQLQTQ